MSTDIGNLTLVDIGTPNDMVIKNASGETAQTVTFNFSGAINIASIFLLNDDVNWICRCNYY